MADETPDDRVMAFIADVARRRANRTEERRVFADRRTAGLRTRHATKLARTRS